MLRCPMRSTSYLPDLLILSLLTGASSDTADAWLEAVSAALGFGDFSTSAAQMCCPQSKPVTQSKSCARRHNQRTPALQVFSQLCNFFCLSEPTVWVEKTRRELRETMTSSALWKRRRSQPRRANFHPRRQASILA